MWVGASSHFMPPAFKPVYTERRKEETGKGELKMHLTAISSCKYAVDPYLIFVISFTQAFCAVEIFYTQNALFVTKLNSRQNSVYRSKGLCKMIHCSKIPI